MCSSDLAQLSNRPGAPDRGWYAGIRDVPVGPLTRSELGARVQSGDVTVDTLVWREGLDDWRPLQQVTELADLLRPAAPATTGGAEVAARSSATRSARPSILDDEDDEATRVAGLDPSLAGIMARSARGAGDKPEPEKPRAPVSSLSPLARPAEIGRAHV